MEKVEELLIDLLKNEDKLAIIYCGLNRLFFENSKWIVRGGGGKKKVTLLYRGDSLTDALKTLAAG